MASPYKNELKGKVSPRFVFIWKVHTILDKAGDFLNGHKKSLVGSNNLKICILA